MARPITLFTGQWADLPFVEVARLAAEWGYDGLEIACWGDHFEVDRALAEPDYVDGRRAILDKHGLKVFAISNHLVGQAVCDHPIDERHQDILPAAKMLEGRTVDKKTDLIVAPASKQASEMLARQGWTAEMMAAGVNVSEATCGPCIGIGHVPGSDSVSLRTFNRNFEGRSGIEDDSVYLCSPEVATAGEISDS